MKNKRESVYRKPPQSMQRDYLDHLDSLDHPCRRTYPDKTWSCIPDLTPANHSTCSAEQFQFLMSIFMGNASSNEGWYGHGE